MRDVGLCFPLHAQIVRHRKTRRLARALGVDLPHAVGLLVCLWSEALASAPNGDVSDWTRDEVAEVLAWQGDPGELWAALVSSGWVDVAEDGRATLHEWADYAGAYLEERRRRLEAARERKRRQRSRERDDDETPGDVTGAVTRDVSVTSAPVPGTRREEKRREEKRSGEKKPARKRAAPLTWEALLAEPYEGHPSALAFFRATFPAYDGENGRLPLDVKLAKLREWWERARGRRWRTPLGVHEALARDYGSARASWERDRQAGRVVAVERDTKPTLTPEQWAERQRRREAEHKQTKQHDEGGDHVDRLPF